MIKQLSDFNPIKIFVLQILYKYRHICTMENLASYIDILKI